MLSQRYPSFHTFGHWNSFPRVTKAITKYPTLDTSAPCFYSVLNSGKINNGSLKTVLYPSSQLTLREDI